eukprot:5692574-Prymnesium_polylepis.2
MPMNHAMPMHTHTKRDISKCPHRRYRGARGPILSTQHIRSHFIGRTPEHNAHSSSSSPSTPESTAVDPLSSPRKACNAGGNCSPPTRLRRSSTYSPRPATRDDRTASESKNALPTGNDPSDSSDATRPCSSRISE